MDLRGGDGSRNVLARLKSFFGGKPAFFLFFVALPLFLACNAESNLKKGDQYFALGEYYDAAAEYKAAYSASACWDMPCAVLSSMIIFPVFTGLSPFWNVQFHLTTNCPGCKGTIRTPLFRPQTVCPCIRSVTFFGFPLAFDFWKRYNTKCKKSKNFRRNYEKG